MTTSSGSIKLTRKFLENERDRLYADPPYAIWRELITNSIDAGATRLDITLRETPSGVLYEVKDDGIGMDRETLEGVYLTIDQTSKGGDNSVGGFGRARLLTCFSMDGYEVETGGWLVTGEGLDWALCPLPGEVPYIGTRVSAWTTKPSFGFSDMSKALRLFLSQGDFRGVEVVYNGATLAGGRGLGEKLGDIRDIGDDTPWGTIYQAERLNGPGNAECVVRVLGVPMSAFPAGMDIVVEVVPGRSREVLTVNRDGLKWNYDYPLRKLLGEIATEGKAAFGPKLEPVVTVFPGKGTRGERSTTWGCVALEGQKTGVGTVDSFRATLAAWAVLPRTAPPQNTPARGGLVPLETDRRPSTALSAILWETPIRVAADIASREAAPAWFPDTWEIKDITPSGIIFSRPVDRKKFSLLLGWNEAVAQALTLLPSGAVPEEWRAGFILKPETYAAVDGYGAKDFLLNPLRGNWPGEKAWGPESLLAAALHEAAHCVESSHGANYAGALTRLIEKLDQRTALRGIRLAMKAA